MSTLQIQPQLLAHADEDALHKDRPLPIEMRSFQRLWKKVLADNSPARFTDYGFPTPPPESQNTPVADQDTSKTSKAVKVAERRQWLAELRMEMEGFRDLIIKIQLILNSNATDRERYEGQQDVVRIKMDAIRHSMLSLRDELKKARETMALRQQYDSLADEIVRNKSLLPREEQNRRLAKLQNDIQMLQNERDQYATTWSDRRAQFMRLVAEGQNMLSLIRDGATRETPKADTRNRGTTPAGGPLGQDPMVTDEPEDSAADGAPATLSAAEALPAKDQTPEAIPDDPVVSSEQPLEATDGPVDRAIRSVTASAGSRSASPVSLSAGTETGSAENVSVVGDDTVSVNESDEDGEIVEDETMGDV